MELRSTDPYNFYKKKIPIHKAPHYSNAFARCFRYYGRGRRQLKTWLAGRVFCLLLVSCLPSIAQYRSERQTG